MDVSGIKLLILVLLRLNPDNKNDPSSENVDDSVAGTYYGPAIRPST